MHATNTLADAFDRLPPHSVESEMCLLASMILDPKAAAEIRLIVSRDAFFQADHQILFDVLCTLHDRAKGVDALILREDLAKRGLLEEIGGIPYLAQILSSVPSAAHGAHYASIVREKWVGRQLIGISNDMLRDAYGPGPVEYQAAAERAMTSLARLVGVGRGDSVQKLGDILIDVYEQMTTGGMPTVASGFTHLDDAISGFGLGEMWLIGGRPSMGKSTLAKQIALRVAKSGTPAAIISLEEGRAKIGRNILSGEAQIDNIRLRKPRFLGQQDWTEITGAISRLGNVPLYVTDKPRRLADIRAEAALLVARHGVKLVVIDYLQRVQAPGRSKYEQVGAASEGISDMLKELGVAGVIPVQLNRGTEHRGGDRPTMSDLRDSGQIEQDADGIIFLHRDDYYRATDPGRANEPMDGIAELVLAKYRDGTRGTVVKLRSNLKYQTFEDTDQQTDPFA